jgi:endo-1,3-1,4-beta-glycanase ExoK
MLKPNSWSRVLLLPALLLAPTLLASAAQAQQAEGKSFVENFSKLSEQRWYISDGWTNGPHQNCTWQKRNVHVSLHGLSLELTDNAVKTTPYSCAEIQTRAVFGYGTYETRVRAVGAPGVVTALFSYVGPSAVSKLPHDEIDFEFLGKDKHAVQLNYFSNGKGGHEYMARFDFDASATFNDYAFEWLPDRIRWFINGKLVHEVHAKAGERFPAQPSKIFLSLWNGVGDNMNQWLGKFVYPGQPLVATYEYVAFTKLGEPCQFPKSIVCQTKVGQQQP